jgi:O-antigen/teichoic acid export membrane protein
MLSRISQAAQSNGIRLDAGLRTAWGDLWDKLRGEGLTAVLLRGSAGAFGVKIAGAALGFLVQVVLARALGVRSYGTFIYVYTWTRIFAVLSRLGFHNSLVRFVPEYTVKRQWALLKGASRRSFQLVALTGGCLAAAVLIFAGTAPGIVGPGRAPAFAVAALGIPLLALLGVEQGLLRGLKRVALADTPELVLRPAFLVVATVVFYLYVGRGSLSASCATALHAGATAIAFVGGLCFLRSASPKKMVNSAETNYETRRWVTVSLPLLAIAGMNLLSRQTSLLMVGSLAGDQAAGILGAAFRLSRLVIFGLLATNMIIAPMIAELYEEGKSSELQKLLTVGAWGIFAFTCLSSLFLIILGPYVLHLFGTGFQAAYIPLVIILGGLITNSLSGVVIYIMMMTGHQNQAALIVGGSVAVNFVLCFILVPRFGVLGAAAAMSVAMTCWNLAMVLYVWWNLDLNPTIFRLPAR